MAELSYRDAVIRGIAQEMDRDNRVVFLGEDIGKAGGFCVGRVFQRSSERNARAKKAFGS